MGCSQASGIALGNPSREVSPHNGRDIPAHSTVSESEKPAARSHFSHSAVADVPAADQVTLSREFGITLDRVVSKRRSFSTIFIISEVGWHQACSSQQCDDFLD